MVKQSTKDDKSVTSM